MKIDDLFRGVPERIRGGFFAETLVEQVIGRGTPQHGKRHITQTHLTRDFPNLCKTPALIDTDRNDSRVTRFPVTLASLNERPRLFSEFDDL